MFRNYKGSWKECQSCLDLQRTAFKSTPDNFNSCCLSGFNVALSAADWRCVQMFPNTSHFVQGWMSGNYALWCVHMRVHNGLKACLNLRGCLHTEATSLMNMTFSMRVYNQRWHPYDESITSFRFQCTERCCEGPTVQPWSDRMGCILQSPAYLRG